MAIAVIIPTCSPPQFSLHLFPHAQLLVLPSSSPLVLCMSFLITLHSLSLAPYLAPHLLFSILSRHSLLANHRPLIFVFFLLFDLHHLFQNRVSRLQLSKQQRLHNHSNRQPLVLSRVVQSGAPHCPQPCKTLLRHRQGPVLILVDIDSHVYSIRGSLSYG